MSANNWRICPQCKVEAEKICANIRAKADAAYGKVPAAEWRAMIDKADEEIDLDETLREDWELGMDDVGEFYVSYRCSCDACNFSFSFKEVKQAEFRT